MVEISEYKKQIDAIRKEMPKESDTIICSVLLEINKDRRQGMIDARKSEKATEKVTIPQMEYLKTLGYKGNLNITKQEASLQIEKLKTEQRD